MNGFQDRFGAATLGRHNHPSRDQIMSYRAPVADIAFTLKHSAGLSQALGEGLYGDLTEADVDAVLEEAGKFASTVIAPLNTVGDKHGTPLKDGKVTMPPGWKEAYTAWAQGGWNGLAASADWGGQGLPHALNAACIEMWNSASMAFGIGPVLTMGAVEALAAYGTDALKSAYLPKLISGELRVKDAVGAKHSPSGTPKSGFGLHPRMLRPYKRQI